MMRPAAASVAEPPATLAATVAPPLCEASTDAHLIDLWLLAARLGRRARAAGARDLRCARV